MCATYCALCELVKTRTHLFAVGIDVNGQNDISTRKMTARSSATGTVALSNVTGPYALVRS